MVRKYVRVDDGNFSSEYDDNGDLIPSRGKPIGVVLAELQYNYLFFGYSLLNPVDQYSRKRGDLTAYGRLQSRRYFIDMRWSDEQFYTYLDNTFVFKDKAGISRIDDRTLSKIEPILAWLRTEFTHHPDKHCKQPAYFNEIIELASKGN